MGQDETDATLCLEDISPLTFNIGKKGLRDMCGDEMQEICSLAV